MSRILFISKYLIFLFILPLLSCGKPYSQWSGLMMSANSNEKKGPSLAEQLGYSKKDIIVIVHADDIGIHKEQTDGAFDSIKIGMVRTGSVIVPGPDFERVASIWEGNSELDLGLHLTLTSGHKKSYRWKPLLPESKVPSLYDPDGYIWRSPEEFGQHLNISEALMEIDAQIKKVLQAGLKPTHIDTHQGTYNWHPDLAKGVMKLSRKYNLPMLPHPAHIDEMRKKKYVFPDKIWMFLLISGEKYNPAYRKKVYDEWLQNLKPGVHQLIVHPSLMSEEYAQHVWRPYVLTGDHAYWSSHETKALAEELGIVFIGFKALQELQAKNWNLPTDVVVWGD